LNLHLVGAYPGTGSIRLGDATVPANKYAGFSDGSFQRSQRCLYAVRVFAHSSFRRPVLAIGLL
jgi:hypothetical protein